MKEKPSAPAAVPNALPKMAWDRLPGWFAVVLFFLHSLSLIVCLAAIGDVGNAVARGEVAGGEMLGTFVAALWTLGLDIAEIIVLAGPRNKRIKRCPERFLYLIELLTAMLCFVAPVCSIFVYTEMRYRRCRYLKDSERLQREDCRSLMGTYGPQDLPPTAGPGLTFLVGMIHCLLFIITATRFLVHGEEAASAVHAKGKRKEESSSRHEAMLEPSNSLSKRSRAKLRSSDLEPML